MTTHSAVDAYDMVLQYAGACNYRDKLDELIISDVRKVWQLVQAVPKNGNH